MAKRSSIAHQWGFTLVELLVVIAVIGLVAALGLPSLNSAIYGAKVAKCISNLRQIGVGMLAHANDNNGLFPTAWDTAQQKSYSTFLVPYMQMDSVALSTVYSSPLSQPFTKAPSYWEPFNLSYSMHGLLGHENVDERVRLAAVKRPSETILLVTGVQVPSNYMRVDASLYNPSQLFWKANNTALDVAIPTNEDRGWPGYINKGKANVLYVAGNAGSLTKGDIRWRHLLPLRSD